MAPRVRRYPGRIEEQSLPDLGGGFKPRQVHPDAFGSPVTEASQYYGRQFERFGAGMVELGEGIRQRGRRLEAEADKFDMSVVRMRENEDRTWAREITTSQFETYKGEEAIRSTEDGLSVYERIKDIFSKRRQERIKGLENENQKRLYNVMFDGIEQRALADSSAYVRGANSQLEKQSYAASAESKYEDIIANRYDDQEIAVLLDLAERDIKHYLAGSDKEFVSVKLQNYRDKAHSGVIEAYIKDKNPIEAWRYFKANTGDISSPVKIEVKKVLENASLEHLTRLKTKEIQIDQNSSTITQKIEAAKNVSSPYVDDHELQKRVRERLKADYEDQLRFDALQKRQDFEDSIEKVINAESYAEALEIARAAKGSDELKLKKIAVDMFSTGGIQTNWEEYTRLRLLPHDDFVKVDLYKSRHLLGDTEYKQLVNLQAKEKNEQKQLRVRTNLALANGALDAMGLNTDKNNVQRSQTREAFFRDFEERLADLQTKKGSAPSSSEVKEVIDDLLLEFYEKSIIPSFVPFIGRDERFKFQVNTPEERAGEDYTPAIKPPELPPNAKWSWKYDGWVFENEGKNFVVKNDKVFLIQEKQWTALSK